ncbi:MAG: DNA repair protein RecO [Desulfobacterota bacterium]|nr:DNA repair protein RecO [Thermodesulfobacteriota bacterium]
MRHLCSQAVVLRTFDFGESDKIVSLFTEEFGRLRLIAKGAKRSRKRFGSGLEPFTHIEAFFADREYRGLARLERCHIIAAFPQIADDVRRVVCGTYMLELVDTLTPERERHPEVFLLLLFFVSLLIHEAFREEMLRFFELRLFAMLGYQPQLMRCVICRAAFQVQHHYKFSVKRGGIVCPACQDRVAELLPLSNGTIRLFQQAMRMDIPKLPRLVFSPAEHEEGRLMLTKFLEYHIGRLPRSLMVMEQLA